MAAKKTKAAAAAANGEAPAANGAVTQSERAQLQEMGMLLRIAKQVAAIETLDEMLGTIVELTATETDADRGTLFLYDDQTAELYSRVAQGPHIREIRILATQGTA